jgi:two-component system response regulator ChvI
MGADDYIRKPFSQRLLIERIRTLLRRNNPQEPTAKAEEIIIRGHLGLDDAKHLCTWKSEPVNLTVTEYLLIKSLAIRPGHVRNREQLIDMAYGENMYIDDRTVDSHIKRVRKKFKDLDPEFDYIETLYGVGYRYREE